MKTTMTLILAAVLTQRVEDPYDARQPVRAVAGHASAVES